MNNTNTTWTTDETGGFPLDIHNPEGQLRLRVVRDGAPTTEEREADQCLALHVADLLTKAGVAQAASGQHTQGRLTFRANGDANSYALIDDQGRWFMSLLLNGEQVTVCQEANLRHLVACWNACEATPTEGVEAIAALGGWEAAVDKMGDALMAQRDELLEALQRVMNIDVPLTGNPSHEELVEHWEYEKSQGRGEADDRLFALSALAKHQPTTAG